MWCIVVLVDVCVHMLFLFLQVQLVKCLEKSRQVAPLRCRQQKCPGSPVVRPAVTEPSCGMLTERQMSWVEEFPHESTTENPVLYK